MKRLREATEDWPLQRIMAFANAAAGLNCLRLGARDGMPSLFEINQAIDGAGAHLDPY